MLLILVSMLAWSIRNSNGMIQFSLPHFRFAMPGSKCSCAWQGGGGRKEAFPHLLHVLLVCSLSESFVSFRSRAVVVVVVSWSCRGLVFSGVDDSKTTRSVSLNVSVNSR